MGRLSVVPCRSRQFLRIQIGYGWEFRMTFPTLSTACAGTRRQTGPSPTVAVVWFIKAVGAGADASGIAQRFARPP